MAQAKTSPTSEGAKLRRLAMNPATELMFTQNSEYQADQTSLTRPDCLRILQCGRIIKSEMSGPDWRRWVQGQDLDGNTVTLAVTVVQMDEQRKRIVVLNCEKDEEVAQ